MTRLTAVIGDPVKHSLSPTIATAAYKELGLDWKMLTLRVLEGKVDLVLKIMRELEMGGMSVTMPHKKTVAEKLDLLDESAAVLGVVNCVVPKDGKLIGHNTDGAGFISSLSAEGISLKGKNILIFGAGGASKAVAMACVSSGANRVGISARSKAEHLAEMLGAPVEVANNPNYADFQILINATPLGMIVPNLNEQSLETQSPISEDNLQADHIVVDLVYNPRETQLMGMARNKGAKVIGGIGMLVGQATEAIHLWTGMRPNPINMLNAVKEQSILK